MGQVIFSTKVTSLGPLVPEFIKEKILVFFQEGAPPELMEISVLHQPEILTGEVKPGDILLINNHSFKITAVGEVANANLKHLGHLVIKFNARTFPELPGDVCVEEKEIPPLFPGTLVQIIGEKRN